MRKKYELYSIGCSTGWTEEGITPVCIYEAHRAHTHGFVTLDFSSDSDLEVESEIVIFTQQAVSGKGKQTKLKFQPDYFKNSFVFFPYTGLPQDWHVTEGQHTFIIFFYVSKYIDVNYLTFLLINVKYHMRDTLWGKRQFFSYFSFPVTDTKILCKYHLNAYKKSMIDQNLKGIAHLKRLPRP